MLILTRLRGLLAWLALFTAFGVAADLRADQDIPPLTSHVVDLTNTLSAGDRGQLEERLVDLEQQKGSQIAILIVPTTEPETIEQYSIRVVENWKLGRAKINDGALLLVAKNDHIVRIESGRGLEGVLSDVVTQRIIQESILPEFKAGNFSLGVTKGIDSMIRLVNGETLPPPPTSSENGDGGSSWPIILFFGLAFSGLFRQLFGKGLGAFIAGILAFAVGAYFVSIAIGFVAGLIFSVLTYIGVSTGTSGSGGGWVSGGFGGGGSSGEFRGGGGTFAGGGSSGRW